MSGTPSEHSVLTPDELRSMFMQRQYTPQDVEKLLISHQVLVDALERIALGISGRQESGLRQNEGGEYGLPNQAKPDWKLAQEALALDDA